MYDVTSWTLKKQHRTSNIQHRTSKDIGFWDGPLPVQVGEGLLNYSTTERLFRSKV